MIPINPLRQLIYFITDIYYCFIPLGCRECFFLNECRGSWLQKRKCKNGCIKLNILRERKLEQDREDKLNSIVKYFEELEQ